MTWGKKTLSHVSLISLSGTSTKLFLNLLIQFYLNSMTYLYYLHQLTSYNIMPHNMEILS